jgi:hypothetical protein
MAYQAHTQEMHRPRSVIVAATLQLLTVIPFLLGTFVVLRYGADAQAAAKAQMVRQGLPAGLLDEQGINFGGSETLAIVLVLILAALALLNLAGKRGGQILSWIFQPILLAMGVIIIPAQLFTARFLESSFTNSGDPVLARIDVHALTDAAAHVMPSWLPYVNIAKLVLTTLGSLLVIIMLAVPAARAYFRGPAPAPSSA